MQKSPIPCVACIITNKEGDYLVSKRKDNELLQFPGGKIDFGEKYKSAIYREVLEETGLKLHSYREIEVVDAIGEDFHYIVFFFEALIWEGIPENLEPDKCYGWEWRRPSDIKEPTLESITVLKKVRPELFQ